MTANRFVTRGGRLPRPEGLSNQASSRKAIVLIHFPRPSIVAALRHSAALRSSNHGFDAGGSRTVST